jgi:DNA-binding response OmpR family regulator
MHAVCALFIGEHPATVAAVRSCLRPRSHALIEEQTSGDGLRRLFAVRPDLVLLDLDLPDGAAWETIDRIREITDVPLLALAEGAPELERARALRAGADDVMCHPIGAVELAARIEALMRRARKGYADAYVDSLVSVDYERSAVTVAGRPIALTPLQYRVLVAFVQHADAVLSPEQLLDLAWNDSNVGVHRVKTYVAYLRQTFRESAGVELPIETVRGFGYRYRPPAQGEGAPPDEAA